MTTTSSYVETLERMQDAFRVFMTIALTVPTDDIAKARTCVNQADAIGFVTDPTLYRTAFTDHRLERQRRLIDLFDSTTRELRLLFPEGMPEGVQE